MFDDLRNESNQDFAQNEPLKAEPSPAPQRMPAKKKGGKLLGMTAPQRFVVAALLLFVVCALGAALLLLTGKVALLG